MRLSYAMLYVKDFKGMKQFYADMLCVEPTSQAASDDWATFEINDIRLALHAIPAAIAANIEITSPPVFRENQAFKMIFEVTDVERERERLESLGASTHRHNWQKAREACDMVDPEGNIFQLRSSCSGG